ncbi:PAS domain-containing sensor histidine kinase [Natrinema halophilum]|uniref:histidine kinase n=1 Tax=Natrinema halophilum TaxID=1699371 RepID=A0A7D5GLI0_9EURY|nr:PAS domain-containing sensor histidine kinase [Natrinema halophilum]QLG47713.1 PAS domain-containing sensor histidine kinase [Natrinema halophilum]
MDTFGSFVTAGFDALPAQVAILDGTGTIVYTNRSWDSFGNAQGMPDDAGGVGSNYLAVCDATDDEGASETARGIRAVTAGDRDEFSLEYPCHTPERDRWFMMQASPYEHGGERFVLAMHVDITERRLLEQRTQEQADQMEGFAKLLSHDLRNPLSVALAQAEMLELDDDIDLDSSNGGRSSLRASLERMETIIDDALVLVTADAVEEPDLHPLATVVETAWGHVRTESAMVSVVDDVAIRADSTLVSHLFENLFRNAVEHAGEDVHLEIGVLERATESDSAVDRSTEAEPPDRASTDKERETGDGNGFYVEDDGPGIPAAERERVFESGYSFGIDAPNDESRSTAENDSDGGSGLGLAIVQHVVDAHGWSISVVAGSDGGARFEVRDVTVYQL